MNIDHIDVQPGSAQLMAAYNPIKFTVIGDTYALAGQPMWCDIYFADPAGGFGDYFYYKTITSFTYDNTGSGGTAAVYNFDIQDACQEYLTTYIPLVQNTDIAVVNLLTGSFNSDNATYCLCKFRASFFDTDGAIESSDTPPIQGNAVGPSVPGAGTESNQFIIVNAALQPMENTDLKTHLQTRSIMSGAYIYDVYSLSNFPYNDVTGYTPLNRELPLNAYYDDWGSFPILAKLFYHHPPSADNVRNVKLGVGFRSDSSFFFSSLISTFNMHAGVYYLPIGIQNLIAINPGLSDVFNPYGLYENKFYYIYLQDLDFNQLMWCSPVFKINRGAGYQKCRLWFQNRLGAMEQVNFLRTSTEHITKSGEVFTPITGDAYLNVSTGRRRFNVRSNDEITASAVFSEAQLLWLEELFDSVMVFQEVSDPEDALVDDPTGLRPVKVIDATMVKRKMEERYMYEVTIKVRPSFDYINHRG